MKAPGRPRVALLSELPTPYRWPVFERLLERDDIDLEIFFCSRTERDRDWSFPFHPDRRTRFLPGRTVSITGRRTIHYHVNPTVFGELERGDYDVVVFPGYAMFASHAGEVWCRLKGTPYIVFAETNLVDRRSPIVRAAKRLVLPVLVGGASAWLATGRLAAEYFVHYGARRDRIFPFPNTPDVDWFAKESEAAVAESERLRRAAEAGKDPVILYVGRLIGVKRVDLLVEAFRRLAEEGLRASLWIVGDGSELGQLQAAARGAGLRCRFFGSQPTARLPAIYGAADLFVLPSDHEPWGAVVNEAMACGLSVVVSDRVGAAPDLVVEGGNGAVFEHGDAGALAGVLGRILADPSSLRRMGRHSAERIRGFTHRECVESFLSAVAVAVGREGTCRTVDT